MNIKIFKKDIKDEFYLKDFENFLNIEDKYYGGCQTWLYKKGYKSKFWANRSCGVTALANLTAYLAKHNKELKDLYPYKSLSINDFTKHQVDLYKYLNPKIYGIASLYNMKQALKKFAKSRNIHLTPRIANWSWNIENISEYIISGLIYDQPILLLTWNTPVSGLKYHWVTITGYIQTNDNKRYIIVSNWGEKKAYSLDKWFNNWSYYKGLIHFE